MFDVTEHDKEDERYGEVSRVWMVTQTNEAPDRYMPPDDDEWLVTSFTSGLLQVSALLPRIFKDDTSLREISRSEDEGMQNDKEFHVQMVQSGPEDSQMVSITLDSRLTFRLCSSARDVPMLESWMKTEK